MILPHINNGIRLSSYQTALHIIHNKIYHAWFEQKTTKPTYHHGIGNSKICAMVKRCIRSYMRGRYVWNSEMQYQTEEAKIRGAKEVNIQLNISISG